MLPAGYRLLRRFLPVLILGALASVSCGGSTGYEPPPECDLSSQAEEQKKYKREDYYPKVFSRDFSRDFGADISPTENDYDIARKVSRSVFEIAFWKGDAEYFSGSVGSGWLIAPGYVVTAAHNPGNPKARIDVHTFDGDTIRAEIVYIDPDREDATDLAVLRLEREIDAVPMKIADARPERNEFLMVMGGAGILRGLGGWAVSAGPALELQSGEPDPIGNPGRTYHAVPAAPGMSGGPIFNRKGEVVSIASAGQSIGSHRMIESRFGVGPFQIPPASPPDNLWLYGFVQPHLDLLSYGPNPNEMRELYDKVPGLEEPENAGEYRNDNEWKRTEHEFGDKYSPFPVDEFDEMEKVYKEAREAVVTVAVSHKGNQLNGSGFIYDGNTVITAGHVAPGKGDRALIKTMDARSLHLGTVLKTQDQSDLGKCDIAIIKMDAPDALGGYPALKIGDSSSLRCGDPLVEIGSAHVYNSIGPFQGVGAVYMLSRKYTSEYISRSASGGMSGGPVVNGEGKVISLTSHGLGLAQDKWLEPGPLIIRTRLPVYLKQDFSEGPNAEMIRRFIENKEFYCE